MSHKLCRPRQHRWQFRDSLVLSTPSNGRVHVLTLHECTRCHAVVEVGGEIAPGSRVGRFPHAGLWGPDGGFVPVKLEGPGQREGMP